MKKNIKPELSPFEETQKAYFLLKCKFDKITKDEKCIASLKEIIQQIQLHFSEVCNFPGMEIPQTVSISLNRYLSDDVIEAFMGIILKKQEDIATTKEQIARSKVTVDNCPF